MGRLGYRHTPEALAKISAASKRQTRHHMPLGERLARHSVRDEVTGCLNWTGQIGNHGYGVLWVKGEAPKSLCVHRVAYELAFGNIPPDKPHVCHHCDNKRCIEPSHLFAGTHLDNVADMVRKQRHRTDHLHSAEALAAMVASRKAHGSYIGRREYRATDETRAKLRAAWLRRKARAI